jgi:hypothetical protein
MNGKGIVRGLLVSALACCCWFTITAPAQQRRNETDGEFGPIVRAYLGYLRNEQEVVDDRASRREIKPAYYRRNSNRIHALRQMAIKIARESGNDYLPELEAATRDELDTLFENPPLPETFHTGQVLNNTFRFLGTVRSVEVFYVFARLDPYEQAELMGKHSEAAPSVITSDNSSTTNSTGTPAAHTGAMNRSRRVNAP